MSEEDFALTPGEIHSSAWAKVERYLRKELDKYRKRNDGDLDDAMTNKTRGRIAQIKELLALAGDPAAGPSDP